MFEPNDEAYLLDVISKGDTLLFLGAGFSSIAKNRLKENLPVGKQLAEKIWNFLGYAEPFDGSSLQIMYEALLGSGKKTNDINLFLEDNLIAEEVPVEYNILNKPYWYKIYTTNVDNIVEASYQTGSNSKLKVISFPSGEPVDRDPFLEFTQLIHLNGVLPGNPNEIIFSIRQYAKATLRNQPLYEQFVREYVIHPTIFLGASLEEPLFWEYLESRQDRSPGTKEYRPKSFVIARSISKVKSDYLKNHFNIHSIQGTTVDFLKWIQDISHKLPEKIDVLKSTVPNVVDFFKIQGYNDNKKEINAFAESFRKVNTQIKVDSYRSLFLLGTTPTWEDIQKNLDAPRIITKEILEVINNSVKNENSLHISALVGSAGCGKSTVLKRLGMLIAQSGVSVYYSDSENLPSPSYLNTFLNLLNERVVLIFDNAEIILNVLHSYARELEKLRKPPVILIACRTYELRWLSGKSKAIVNMKEHIIPTKLEKEEIENIIEVLDHNDKLGYLKGLSRQNRIKEFESRSSKQLLVAMREATSGKGFDEIINSEFDSIKPEEARLLTLCVALVTDAGYTITHEDFIGFSHLAPGDTLDLLNRTLQDIIIPTGKNLSFLALRHRTIAAYLIEEHVSRELLSMAYIRVLESLSLSIKGRHWRDKKSSLYRDLLNHRTIYRRFNKQIESARLIYDSLSEYLSDDFHYWLQYSNLELEGNGGNLVLAENYLDQAASIKDDYKIPTARGHLLLKKSVFAQNKSEAVKYREEGEEILLRLIQNLGYEDPYFYHIYCHQVYNWINKWTNGNDEEKKLELERLKKICSHGLEFHPKNNKLDDMINSILRASYNLGIDPTSRPSDPIILLD